MASRPGVPEPRQPPAIGVLAVAKPQDHGQQQDESHTQIGGIGCGRVPIGRQLLIASRAKSAQHCSEPIEQGEQPARTAKPLVA